MHNDLIIKASENSITIETKLELIAIRESISKRNEIASVEWSFEPKHERITLTDNKLLITSDISGISEITVYCVEINTKIRAERTFKVSHQCRLGKLVHFIRGDNIYSGDDYAWSLWTYASNKMTSNVAFSTFGDFGVSAISTNNQVIAHKMVWDHSWCNEWAEQSCVFELDMLEDNYYIVYGDATLYTSLNDVVNRTNPRLEYAIMDENINAHLSHEALPDTYFDLYINSNKQNDVVITHENRNITISNLPSSIMPSDLLVIKANQTFSPCMVQFRSYLDKFYYAGNDLGIIFTKSDILLGLWAPTAIYVELLLYKNFDTVDKEPDYVFRLNNDVQNNIHNIRIDRLPHENLFYMYRLHFNYLDKNNQNTEMTTYAVDPYATALAINGIKGCLIDLDSPLAKPDGWVGDKKPDLNDSIIIYETHVRDLTIDHSCNSSFPGKYIGLSESNTCFTDKATGISVKTGMDSLVELGITHVHLLPVFDFASVDETKMGAINNRNWGYDPRNYNTPTGIYSTNAYNPHARIREFREMVHSLHKQGLRVVIDVVYNHMVNTINFDKIVPGYYFRSDKYGRFTNGSGCGNELATERPQVSKFILDSIMHWILDYKVDGLRFDLMELIDIDTIKKVVSLARKTDPGILIYGEPWRASDTPLKNGTYRGSQKNENFAIFNDNFRNAIRGNNNPGHGFVNGNSHNSDICWGIIEGLKGSIYTLTASPQESINYVDAHDNYTLWDHIEKSHNTHLRPGEYHIHIDEDNLFGNMLIRQNLLAIGLVLTAQGIPFLHGGVELLRSKRGDHNSYKSSDIINAFNWQDKVRFLPVFEYIKGLIKLRKEHPAFRIKDRKIIESQLVISTTYNDDKSGVILSHFKDSANGDSWHDVVVIYNATSIDNYCVNKFLPLPQKGLWHIVVNHEKAGIETIGAYKAGELPPLRSYSMMIIHS
ncbi:MAG: pulA [Burkholderiales bacterium]|jgi:pullulanase|nr:pulA [Burkholderiales bacterium]